MGWLRKRLGETSTKKGAAFLAAILGMALGPESVDAASQTIAGGLAMWEMIRAER